MSLIDLFRIMRRYRWLLLAAPLLMVMIGLIAATLMRPVWEASALIEIGKLGKIGAVGELIETPGSTVGRLMNPGFGHGIFRRLGITPNPIPPELKLFQDSVKARAIPNTELIELKLKAYSPEEAKNQILAVVNQLRATQDETFNSHISYTKRLIAVIADRIEASRNAMNALAQKIARPKPGTNEVVLYAMLYQGTSKEINKLEQKKLQLEETLSPQKTYLTRLAGELYITDKPVAPKKRAIISLAALLGLLSAIFFAVLHNSSRNKA